MKIGVIVAMDAEFRLIHDLLEEKRETCIGDRVFVQGRSGTKTVVLAKSGIGKVCSALGTVEMIRNFVPDAVINTGVAGGIDRCLGVMDIVVGERTIYHDVWCGGENAYGQIQGMPVYYEADPHLYRTALSVPAPVNLTGGVICTGDRFITDRTELEAIKNKFPEGLAVDMESCSMAQVCYLEKVPFLSFRVISDTPGVEKHELQYRHFWTAAPQESFEVFREFLKAL